MKNLLLLFITLFFTITSMAQTIEIIVSGTAKNSKNVSVESATISFIQSNDSSVVEITLSNKGGKSSFTNIPYGNYFITVSSVGLGPDNSTIFPFRKIT